MAGLRSFKSVERPRISFIHLAFLSHIISTIIALWGFWAIETILWNRIAYSNGEWVNSLPLYLNSTLAQVEELLLSNSILFTTGILIIFLISSLMFLRYSRERINWNPTTRLLFRIQLLVVFICSLMGFWLYMSVLTISDLRSIGEGQSGAEWLRTDIRNYSDFFFFFGLLINLIFAFFIVATLIILFLNREREETRFKQRFSLYQFILNSIKRLPFYLVISGYLLLTLIPVLMTILVSFSTTADLRMHRLPSIPLEAFIKNFSSVVFAVSANELGFAAAFLYSIILGFGTGLLGLAVSLSAGYALARFKFAGNKILTFMILATQMFPGLILLIPQYVIWTDMGLLREGTLLFGVLLAYISGAVAYCTWMMKGYFETIPLDLEEAALIDGAGRLGTFTRIAVPLAKPGMVAVLIFTFLTAWSEFVLARTFIGESNPILITLPLLFYNYQNPGAPENPIFFELLAPYAILVALPPVLLFLFLQKELAAGAVAGAVK